MCTFCRLVSHAGCQSEPSEEWSHACWCTGADCSRYAGRRSACARNDGRRCIVRVTLPIVLIPVIVVPFVILVPVIFIPVFFVLVPVFIFVIPIFVVALVLINNRALHDRRTGGRVRLAAIRTVAAAAPLALGTFVTDARQECTVYGACLFFALGQLRTMAERTGTAIERTCAGKPLAAHVILTPIPLGFTVFPAIGWTVSVDLDGRSRVATATSASRTTCLLYTSPSPRDLG